MDRLSYRQSLWPMTDEQIEKEYNEKSNWKNMDDLELFREVEYEHGKRKYRQEQKMNRKKEKERVGVLVLEYDKILKKWLKQGVKKINGAYKYNGRTMYWNVSSKHIDEIIVKLREEDEKFQIIKLTEEQSK